MKLCFHSGANFVLQFSLPQKRERERERVRERENANKSDNQSDIEEKRGAAWCW